MKEINKESLVRRKYKKTVILIHGYLTNYLDFNHLPKYLSKYYDYVVILDLPGHGRYRNIKDFKVDATIKKVEKEVEYYLAKGFVDLIGFSMGGALSRYLCVKYKEIRNAVLLAPATYYLSPLFTLERMKYIITDNKKGSNTLKELKENDKISYDVIKELTLKKFNLDNGLTFCKLIYKINSKEGFNPTRTLVMRGILDELVPKYSAEYCYKNCINSEKEIVHIKGLGHLMLRSNKEQLIIDKIMEFLVKYEEIL